MKDTLEMREWHTDGCDAEHLYRGDGEGIRILRCHLVPSDEFPKFQGSFFLHLQDQTVQDQFGLLDHDAKGTLNIEIFGGTTHPKTECHIPKKFNIYCCVTC